MNRKSVVANLDALTILIYLALVTIGLFSIYSAVYNPEHPLPIYTEDYSKKQMMWIGCAFVLIVAIMILDYKVFDALTYIFYGFIIFLLVLVLFIGVKIGGARAWLELGFMRLQPAEFAKLACSLAVAKYLSKPGVRIKNIKSIVALGAILGIPALLILMQPDAGSMLVFASFLLVFYREGLPSVFLLLPLVAAIWFVLALIVPIPYLAFAILIICSLVFAIYHIIKRKFSINFTIGLVVAFALQIGYIFSVSYLFDNVLKPHQKERIMILLDEKVDEKARGSRYNLRQSQIAIGSGGFTGKGYLEGTQTKLNFVPEQRTDFIFCTIGEEGGFLGSLLLIGLFVGLLSRIIIIAERQTDAFVRIYAYCVASIFFFHFTLNISMTLGLFPVIGIPLPFISYGGSSLWSFTLLLFTLLKLDAHRNRLFTG